MDPYADYDFYTDDYHGTAISEAAYPALALLATAFINRITFSRAADETDEDTVELIQMAQCAVADELKSISDAGGADAITSETVGRHSVSYAANASAARTNDQKKEDAAALFLAPTGLMFKGFNSGEYGVVPADED